MDGTDDVKCPTGYSVSSGEFTGDGQTAYVAGAPRAAHGYGKVRISKGNPPAMDEFHDISISVLNLSK